jgi:hypothetical protein
MLVLRTLFLALALAALGVACGSAPDPLEVGDAAVPADARTPRDAGPIAHDGSRGGATTGLQYNGSVSFTRGQ